MVVWLLSLGLFRDLRVQVARTITDSGPRAVILASVPGELLVLRRQGEAYVARGELSVRLGSRGFAKAFGLRTPDPVVEDTVLSLSLDVAIPWEGTRLRVSVRDLGADKELLDKVYSLGPLGDSLLAAGDPVAVDGGVSLGLLSRDTVEITWWLQRARGRLGVLEGRVRLPPETGRVFVPIPWADLPSDSYRILVRVSSPDGNLDREGALVREGLGGFSGERFEALVSVLGFLYGDRVRPLAEAPPWERERAWEAFWRDVGEDQREAFTERYRVALDRFSRWNGTLTDRGLIYVKYGPPDEVESHPFELGGPPWEVWYYNSLGLRFVFVDKHGLGEYELVSPNFYDPYAW